MTATSQPSVAAMGLSKAQYVELADQFRDKAQEAHHEARAWQNKCLLAESQLAVLRAAYEPPRTSRHDLTDAAGNPEPVLPSLPAESE